MKGFSRYTQSEPAPDVQIKADWGQGVNTVLPADRLPPMQFTHGLNIELREGYPVTRHGVGRANWLYRNGVKLGEVFQGHGLIQGADPDPVLRLPLANLVVCDNDLWICAPNNEPTLIMEDCTEALQEVEIIDAFDEALILRNLNQTPLRYRYEPGHFPEELPAARDGQTALPNARTGCYAGNRIWLVLGKNEVVASDIFEWDYNTTETRWQVDDGEGDEIVRLWPVGENRIVVFKTRSVHVIEGVAGLDTVSDVPVQVNIYRVAAARGCVAPYAISQRGQTLFYLSRDGLEALVLSDNAVTAMSDKPLSLAVERYWKQLRWLDVAGARMAIAHQHLMISVPTRYREDESIPSLLLGGAFTEEEGATETEVCSLTHVTYSGSGTWCGFSAFMTFNDGITPRYLTKTVKGFQQYVNSYFGQTLYPTWSIDRERINNTIALLLADDDTWTVDDIPPISEVYSYVGFQDLSCIESAWYGQASYDPSDGCALANNIHVFRRTNGWEYAGVAAFGAGAETSDEIVADVDALFSGPYPGSHQTVTGYNTTAVEGETVRVREASGITTYSNQLGGHTLFGRVREILGNEHTLFDQLVIDGAVVTPTRTSEIHSFNDSTGVFDASISAFRFTLTAGLNESGANYEVSYRVLRTTGATSELEDVTVSYTGDGTVDRVLTIQVKLALPGTTTQFSGECVTVRAAPYEYDDFERLTSESYTNGPIGGWAGWANAGRILCGIKTSVDDFSDLEPSQAGYTIYGRDGPYSGNCWSENWRFIQGPATEAYGDFEIMAAASDVVVWRGGLGWEDIGRCITSNGYLAHDDFESYTAGVITSLDGEEANWSNVGRII